MAIGTESEANNIFAQRNVFQADVRTIDGALFSPGDVDFLTFQGLAAGTTFVAETVFLSSVLNQVFDTVIQRHDDSGGAIAGQRDDDSGAFNLSRLQGTVGSSGTLNLSIFTNEGSEQQGAYQLQLSLALNGTGGADLLAASNYAEAVSGLGGNDTLTTAAGADSIDGGDGNDLVNAGDGDDRALGGTGNDTLNGNAGRDTLDGGSGDDTLVGGPGNDVLLGNLGNDSLDGGDGADSIAGGDGTDTLTGGGGNDTLEGGTGPDTLAGGLGNDLYLLSSAADVVTEAAGGGIDTVRVGTIEGGQLPGEVRLEANVERLELFGAFSFSGLGNGLANTMIGNEGSNQLRGEAGNDTLFGGGGSDLLGGGTGNNFLEGGAGDDIYVVDSAADVIVELPGGGFDTVFTIINGFVLPADVEGIELLGAALNATGNARGNRIVGNAGDNSLSGLGGLDTLSGADGADTIDGGAGDDALDGGAGTDVLSAGDGNDTLIGGLSDDTLMGGAGNDVFDDGAGNDLMNGGAGDDRINFARVLLPGQTVGDGDDTLDGGAGNDSLFSGAGNDLVLGGAGDDQLFGGDGIDTIEGGAGDDRIDGGSGRDVLIGGLGADVVSVGLLDRIVYRAAAESTVLSTDTIAGFDAAGGAVIDLSAIDAITGGADNAFVFIGGAAFTAAGQVRVVASGTDARVEANLDAELSTAELAIEISGVFGFFDSNTFIL